VKVQADGLHNMLIEAEPIKKITEPLLECLGRKPKRFEARQIPRIEARG